MKTIKKEYLPHLAVCIILDLIGYASFAFPVLGEFSDIIWAPLSGFLFYKLFGGKMGVVGGKIAFLEELLPFTDFIPSFTIGWLLRYRSFSKTKTLPAYSDGI